MLYSFDIWGWLSEIEIPGRQTEVMPPNAESIPEGQKPNFTGHQWILLPYLPPPMPDPELEARLLGQRLSQYLDEKARERDYDDMKSVCSYALSGVSKYKAQGLACVAYRDAVWQEFEQMIQDVKDGVRPLPNYEDFVAEIPVLEWPV